MLTWIRIRIWIQIHRILRIRIQSIRICNTGCLCCLCCSCHHHYHHQSSSSSSKSIPDHNHMRWNHVECLDHEEKENILKFDCMVSKKTKFKFQYFSFSIYIYDQWVNAVLFWAIAQLILTIFIFLCHMNLALDMILAPDMIQALDTIRVIDMIQVLDRSGCLTWSRRLTRSGRRRFSYYALPSMAKRSCTPGPSIRAWKYASLSGRLWNNTLVH